MNYQGSYASPLNENRLQLIVTSLYMMYDI